MQPILIAGAFGVAILVLLMWIIVLEVRLRRIFRGGSAVSLETLISKNQQTIEHIEDEQRHIHDILKTLDGRLRKKIVSAKTIRFNPFQGSGVGGNQSFATALLDEQGDGVVLSTLYSREKVSIFAKPIKGRSSEYDLTQEEQEVLK